VYLSEKLSEEANIPYGESNGHVTDDVM